MTGQIELAAGPSAQAHGAPGAHLRIDARIKLLELGKERAILPAELDRFFPALLDVWRGVIHE